MVEFIFVRHGEPDYERIADWCKNPLLRDFAPLTKQGVQQIQETASKLQEEGAEIILASPYTRALETAYIVAKELGLEVMIEPDLHEWELDKKQKHKNKITEKLLLTALNKKVHIPFITGRIETKEQVQERVFKVLQKYTSYSKVIVCCHACVMGYVTDDFRAYAYGETKHMLVDSDSSKSSNIIDKARTSFAPPNTLDQIGFVCILARHQGKWVASWHKKRAGWEFPGGHVEKGEEALEAAKRELYEETGAAASRMLPLWDYHFVWENGAGWNNGRYYYADISEFAPLPESEMSKIDFFDDVPSNYTYNRGAVVCNVQKCVAIVEKASAEDFIACTYKE